MKNSADSGAWRCNNTYYNSLCLFIRIFNTNCQGIETIEITSIGAYIDDDADIYALFSLENENNQSDFFTFATDWDGAWSPYNGGDAGGVYIAPICTSNLLTKSNLFNIISDVDTSDVWSNRAPMAGGNQYNWDALTLDPVGTSTTPLYYTFTNNLIDNTLNATFDASTVTKQYCQYGNTFDTASGNDYIIIFAPDGGILQFTQFNIDITCEVF